MTAIVLPIVTGDSHFGGELEVVEFEPSLQEGVVEPVAVVASDDVWVVVLDELGKLEQSVLLGGLVED